jgi:hypothetical protein
MQRRKENLFCAPKHAFSLKSGDLCKFDLQNLATLRLCAFAPVLWGCVKDFDLFAVESKDDFGDGKWMRSN